MSAYLLANSLLSPWMGTSRLKSMQGLSAPALPPPTQQCTLHFQLSLQKLLMILMSHCVIKKWCQESNRGTTTLGHLQPSPQFLQQLIRAGSTGYLPEAQCGTYSSSDGTSWSFRSCRMDKSEGGPWFLQPLPSQHTHDSNHCPLTHQDRIFPSAGIKTHEQKPSHEQFTTGQHPKAKPFPSSPRRLLCRARACSAHCGRAEHSCPQVWSRRAGNQE